jgi:hypothetical protein
MRRRRPVSWRSHAGKTKYKTLRVARWSATLRTAVSGESIGAYRCLLCGRFHIGHSEIGGPTRDKPWLYDGHRRART